VVNVVQELDQMDSEQWPVASAVLLVIKHARNALRADYKYLFLTLVMLVDAGAQSEFWNMQVFTPESIQYVSKRSSTTEIRTKMLPIHLFTAFAGIPTAESYDWQELSMMAPTASQHPQRRGRLFTSKSLAVINNPQQV
jgi:hypothetical protein